MSNLDDSIGKILLDLQKDDPDTFKKLMKKVHEENPELFEDSIDQENSEIDEYNRKIDKFNNNIDKNASLARKGKEERKRKETMTNITGTRACFHKNRETDMDMDIWMIMMMIKNAKKYHLHGIHRYHRKNNTQRKT